MSTQPLSPIRKAWYRWKALRLPWRKRFFIGSSPPPIHQSISNLATPIFPLHSLSPQI